MTVAPRIPSAPRPSPYVARIKALIAREDRSRSRGSRRRAHPPAARGRGPRVDKATMRPARPHGGGIRGGKPTNPVATWMFQDIWPSVQDTAPRATSVRTRRSSPRERRAALAAMAVAIRPAMVVYRGFQRSSAARVRGGEQHDQAEDGQADDEDRPGGRPSGRRPPTPSSGWFGALWCPPRTLGDSAGLDHHANGPAPTT